VPAHAAGDARLPIVRLFPPGEGKIRHVKLPEIQVVM
jgi:hypothetical protein